MPLKSIDYLWVLGQLEESRTGRDVNHWDATSVLFLHLDVRVLVTWMCSGCENSLSYTLSKNILS